MKNFFLFTILLILVGCSKEVKSELKNDPIAAPGYIFNFTNHSINSVWVNGKWIGSAPVNAAGGAVCCVELPRPYQTETTLTIEWERNICKGFSDECLKRDKEGNILQEKLKRKIKIHPYDSEKISMLQIVFLPGDDIRAYAGMLGLEHPNHPSHKEFGDLLTGKYAPLEGVGPFKKEMGN